MEKVFDRHTRAMNSLEEDLVKKQEKILEFINVLLSEKGRTKNEEKIIQSFVNEIHKIV